MQGQSWTNFTGGQGGPSVGVSNQISTGHLVHDQWMTRKTITLGTLDRDARGAARFVTIVEMTGSSQADLPSAAACRLACYYMLGHLNEASLLTACNSLADIYSWQVERARLPK